jgi:PIN domain nuclease of toxin-antitoxin system
MILLLDTHVLLWAAANDGRLSSKAKTLIQDPEQRIYVSVVSAWEMIIKHGNGKLLPLNNAPELVFLDAVRDNQYEVSAVDLSHIMRVAKLETHHKDPFDRLLIAQTLSEGLVLLTDNGAIQQYNVPNTW